MCTAAVEGATEAPVGPFSATIPHNAKYYAFCGVTYLFALRWQQKDRALKREIDAYKAEHAPPAPAVVEVEAPAATPAAAAPSAVVQAVTAAPTAAPGASIAEWKVADVAAWLESVELAQHVDTFKTHSVNGKMLLTLSDSDLYQTLEVKSPLHRKKLLMEISQLRKGFLSK